MNKINVLTSAGQPSTTVIVNQGQPRTDFTFPEGLVPSIMMLIISLFNLGFFIAFVLHGVLNFDVIVAFVFYFITSVLGIVGAAKKQITAGVATGCVIMSVFCLLTSLSQMIRRGLGILFGQILIATNQKNRGEVILWGNVILLVLSVLACALSIALIAIPSKVVCPCCQGPQQPGVVVVQQGMGRGVAGRLA